MAHQNNVPSFASQQRSHLLEVVGVFLRLGFTAFGGPAAHIAMMREEIVQRRQWIKEDRFLDLIGITNLIPGPSSTELAIYLGYLRAGWPGLLLAGICFIGPAMLLVLAFAWTYIRYGALPQADWLLYGIQPVVIAVIAQALWNLGRTILRSPWPILLSAGVLTLYLLGGNTLLLLFGGALFFAALRWGKRLWVRRPPVSGLVVLYSSGMMRSLLISFSSTTLALTTAMPVSLLQLFLTFLKLGAVIYGSGYTLLAFLRADLVQSLHWLTDKQLLAAVSIGQFTPGPVFTTATFIGYVVGGWPGALLATLGIFLPSFVFIALVHPLAVRLRQSAWTAALLDGVNAAALALMAGVLVQIGQHGLTDILTWVVALTSFVVLLRWPINSVWLILLGALIGMIRFSLF